MSDARERLARWLADEEAAPRGMEPHADTSWACVRGRWLAKADRLLPVVDAIAAERAAEELNRAAFMADTDGQFEVYGEAVGYWLRELSEALSVSTVKNVRMPR